MGRLEDFSKLKKTCFKSVLHEIKVHKIYQIKLMIMMMKINVYKSYTNL